MKCRRCELGVFLSFPLIPNWLRNKRDVVSQVTVAAEGCDYAALILIVISNQQWTESECYFSSTRATVCTGWIWWGPFGIQDLCWQQEKQGANFCRETSDGRTFCRWHWSDTWDSSVIYSIWLVVKNKKQPTRIILLMCVGLCVFIFATYWEDLSLC